MSNKIWCVRCNRQHTATEWQLLDTHLAGNGMSLDRAPASRGNDGRAVALALALAGGFVIAALLIGWIYLVSMVAP